MIDFDPVLEPAPAWVVAQRGARLHLLLADKHAAACGLDRALLAATREQREALTRCRRCCLVARVDQGVGVPAAERYLRAFVAGAVPLPMTAAEC